jgi:hypothetical protein
LRPGKNLSERETARACPIFPGRPIDSAAPPRYLHFEGYCMGRVGFVMEVASETILRLADDASVQHVGDGAVVLLARSGQLYTCNGTTEAFLDKVDGARSLDQIVGLLCAEFEVDKDTLDQDMAALANDLMSEGILAAPGA